MARTVDVEEVDDAVLMKAFWLQRHIHEHGIEGIGFMQEGEETAKDGDQTVAGNISARLNLQL